VFSDISTKLIKQLTVAVFPGVQAFRRPEGATRCDAFSSGEESRSGFPGFPSGHCSLAALYATVFLLGPFFVETYRRRQRQKKSKDTSVSARRRRRDGEDESAHDSWDWRSWWWRYAVGALVAIALIGSTAYARVSKRCHNTVQVAGGTVWGILLGGTYLFAVREA